VGLQLADQLLHVFDAALRGRRGPHPFDRRQRNRSAFGRLRWDTFDQCRVAGSVHRVEIALHRIVVSRCMHIGLLREKDYVLYGPGRRCVSYDHLTTRRFRLTGYKIACLITPGLCAIQHFQKFLKVIYPQRQERPADVLI